MSNALAVATALSAILYTWLTYLILRSNRDTLRLMQQQSLAATRPYVSVAAVSEVETPLFLLQIRNSGQTPAFNLRLELDRPFYQFGEKRAENNLSSFRAFQEPIACFPPGAELLFYLAQAFVVFAENADPSVTPPVFKVTATYSFANQTVTEVTPVDLKAYMNTAMKHDRRTEVLEKAIREVAAALKR
ncbi:MAG: hypothetical protein ACYC4D_10085 [Thermoleophilia bacterium]